MLFELNQSKKDNSILRNESDSLKTLVENMKKNYIQEIETLNERCNVLQNIADKTNYNNKEVEDKINNLKDERDNIKSKYMALIDEMEIANNNLRKTFQIETQIKQLQEENNNLTAKLKNQKDAELIQNSLNKAEDEIKELNEKYKIINSKFEEISKENTKLNQENFAKFQKIVDIEKEMKIKIHKLNEKDQELLQNKQNIIELNNKISLFQNEIKAIKFSSDSQKNELQKEIDKLLKMNENAKKEFNEISTQLKNIQTYTNFAKASKDSLNKKDFSILEKMSNRVEELEALTQNFRAIINQLESENVEMKQRIRNLEEISLYYISTEIVKNKEIYENIELDTDQKELLSKLKSDNNSLLELVYNLKRENISFQKDIEIITVECNQLLREKK